ncbi:MAG: GDSL-type esterase/lipase family protein [Terracidiphilus sp.]
MTQCKSESPEFVKEARLPKRDFILLPAISLFTVLTILVASEFVCRLIWPEQTDDACLVSDPVFHAHFRPNCKSRTKPAEGPWSDNSYNECGYRTLESCGPKRPGTIRVAVIGASFSFGYGSPYNDVYTTLAGKALTRQCKRSVEFQNLGIENGSLLDIYRRTDEALALKPDLLLLVAGEGEVTKEMSPDELARRNDPPRVTQDHKPVVADSESLRHSLFVMLKQSRVTLVLQHFMFQDPSTYGKLYLAYDDKANFLRVPFSSRWQQRFSNIDVILGAISDKARASSVPMAILIAPTQAQLALANTPPSADVNLQAFPNKVSELAVRHGVFPIDLLPSFTHRPDFKSLIYAADGHPSPQGQHVVADVLDKQLLSSGMPAFEGCRE